MGRSEEQAGSCGAGRLEIVVGTCEVRGQPERIRFPCVEVAVAVFANLVPAAPNTLDKVGIPGHVFSDQEEGCLNAGFLKAIKDLRGEVGVWSIIEGNAGAAVLPHSRRHTLAGHDLDALDCAGIKKRGGEKENRYDSQVSNLTLAQAEIWLLECERRLHHMTLSRKSGLPTT